MSPLRKQLEDDLAIRGMSERTRETYVGAVAALAKHYGRSPDRISPEETQRYLLHLLTERKLAPSSCNVAASAFQFFYRITLKRSAAEFTLPRPKQPQKLPQILAREEIARLFGATENLKHRAMLMTAYGAGLRVSELCHLKLGDIDSTRMTIRVEQGKGAKDRYTLLSGQLLAELRRYWLGYRPKHWLFVGGRCAGEERPIAVITAQRIYGSAKARAGITKDGGIHALRHAFATHLLEAGVDVPRIQRLMGHGHVSSTLRYFHLADRHLAATPSPLELLERTDSTRL
jgi:site-specific recombinase XerD